MPGLGGYSARNYNGSPPNMNVIPPQLNEFDLAHFPENDELGGIPPMYFERTPNIARFKEDGM